MRKRLLQTVTAAAALSLLFLTTGCGKQEAGSNETPTITVATTPAPTEEAGKEPTTEAGKEPTTEAGKEPTTEAGKEPTTEAGKEPATEAGKEPTTDAGKEPTTEAGKEPTTEAGKEPTTEAGKEPTTEAGKEPTTEAGKEPTPEAGKAPAKGAVQGVHVHPAAELKSSDRDAILTVSGSLLTSIEAIENTENTAKPLFWRVTDPDGEGVLYLLGSFHITDSMAYQVHPQILRAYEESDAVALEFDLLPYVSIPEKSIEMYSTYVDPTLTTVDKVIGTELYERVKAFLTEHNSYVVGLEYYKPYYWDSLVTNIVYQLAGIGDVVGYDIYFNSLAYRDGKPVLEFESMEEQSELLLSADNRMYIMDLESALEEDSRNESVASARELYESWLAGDEEALLELVNPDYSDPEFLALEEDLQENLKSYNKAMYEDRNNNMAAGMTECIENGTVTLCIVGTAHFIGENGVVRQLQAAGYTVEKIVLE